MKQKRTQKQQSISDKLFKFSEDLEKHKDQLIRLQLNLIKKFVGMFVIYGFLSALFLGIYASLGFEKTLVILGVGVIFWAMKQNYTNLKRVLILEQLVRDGKKGRNDKKAK